MTIEEIQTICQLLPGTTEDIKWDDTCALRGRQDVPRDLTRPGAALGFICGHAREFEELTAKEGISRHQYLGRYGWVGLESIHLLTTAQWEHYIRQSYQRVAAKLPLKTRKQLVWCNHQLNNP
jgi:predicted DNA-binding protein (MmcQ/YjbR family)